MKAEEEARLEMFARVMQLAAIRYGGEYQNLSIIHREPREGHIWHEVVLLSTSHVLEVVTCGSYGAGLNGLWLRLGGPDYARSETSLTPSAAARMQGIASGKVIDLATRRRSQQGRGR